MMNLENSREKIKDTSHKCHIMCDSIYNLSRMDKPIETEKRWGKMES